MKRQSMRFLFEWLAKEDRKPLVIRGARQVGKTWLVRFLAESQKKRLIELNFEKKPQWMTLFASNDPSQILLNLNAAFNEEIDPNNSLLFLDEIQAAPQLFAKLRWFAEDFPQLPVIAAGSLLEFVLEDHSFSMPVGRISYMHLEPFSFEEFLLANDKETLLTFLSSYQWHNSIPAAIHEQLMGLLKEYMMVGGMPAAVSQWVRKKSLKNVSEVHHDLMATYRDDFAKYKGRLAIERLDEVMRAIPKDLGKKFMYSKVNPSVRIDAIKNALNLLCKARVCHRVIGCAANGVPLAAEIQDKYLKVIFLDVGLCSAALGLSLEEFQSSQELILINNGGIAEQVVGQLLRTINPQYMEPSLYYWHKEEKGSDAEIDYVIQHHNQVVPIEVKAGTTGSLKSLHLFIGLKQFPIAVRVNSDFPSFMKVKTTNAQGMEVSYTLYSLPFYLLGQLHRLLDSD